MRLRSCRPLLAVATLTATLASSASSSSSQAQLYLSPAPSTSASTTPITLTAPQANAVLAHHLGIAQFEHYPKSVSNAPADHAWEEALSGSDWHSTIEESPKLVVMMECGPSGCSDLIPPSLASQQAYLLPNLPTNSWTAVLTLHLHRLANTLGLTVEDEQVWGLEAFVEAIKSVDGWMGWVGEELGSAIGWSKIQEKVKAAVEPIRSSSGLLTDLDFLGDSSKVFVSELESLAALVDSLSSASHDDGPQSSSLKQIVAVHLKGLSDVSTTHRAAAATLSRQTLDATIAAFHRVAPNGQIVLLALPPYSPPLLRKRAAWLKPFELMSRYTRRAPLPSPGLHKRQLAALDEPDSLMTPTAVVDDDAEGRVISAAARTPTPVVPSSSMCFKDADDVNNQTASCLGRGVPVMGVTVRGGECWVCSCGKTEVDGKTQYWAGEGCQKEDLSGDFNLLFFSGLGLVVILFVSVMLLAGVGSQELPGTLASVTGNGGGSHRD